jgi:hypothetical protein
VELYLHSRNTPSWRGAQLKHRDNFTFTFTIRFINCIDHTVSMMKSGEEAGAEYFKIRIVCLKELKKTAKSFRQDTFLG